MHSDSYINPDHIRIYPYKKPKSPTSKSDYVSDDYVIPLDVLYCLIDKVPGPSYTNGNMQFIFSELESFSQFAYRSGFVISQPNDKELDVQIISSLNSLIDKEVSTLDCVRRIEQHWACIRRMDLPLSLKMAAREELSKLTLNGISIIDKDSSLHW